MTSAEAAFFVFIDFLYFHFSCTEDRHGRHISGWPDLPISWLQWGRFAKTASMMFLSIVISILLFFSSSLNSFSFVVIDASSPTDSWLLSVFFTILSDWAIFNAFSASCRYQHLAELHRLAESDEFLSWFSHIASMTVFRYFLCRYW